VTDAASAGAPGDAMVDVDGRRLRLTTLERPMWPAAGLTKRWLVGWYATVAPVLVPHVKGHPLTLHRYPAGVEGEHFYQTRAPSHPAWVRTVRVAPPRSGKVFDVIVLDDRAGLVWAAQIAAVELHPYLGTAAAPDRPTAVVFDLDPRPPVGLIDAARVALLVRDVLDGLGLAAWPKTSGGKGIHVVVPTGATAGYATTKPFARAVAARLRAAHPDLVVDTMNRARGAGRVLVDWSQNDPGKSTVAPYSLRGHRFPTVSTPLTWAEVEAAARTGDPDALRFTPADVIARIGELGDLHAAVASLHQELPPV
jgi:bifunctional non-homologous end joining protein LigD